MINWQLVSCAGTCVSDRYTREEELRCILHQPAAVLSQPHMCAYKPHMWAYKPHMCV